MTSGALITMVVVQLTVTIVTIYFFYKVLRSPKKTGSQAMEDKPDQ
jgi:hypothetical protein